MDPTTIRIVCALLAVILLAVLIMRRRKHAE
jgi:hypothetical protein